MADRDRAVAGQVSSTAAQVYDEFFVPALFQQWAPVVLAAAGLQQGHDVLDVGCGTGVLAREAARRLAGTGSVAGLDVNEGMLAVARQAPEPVTWQQGRAESLPFPDGAFDRVVSQFVLMFVQDQRAAVAEMVRVTRPQGTVTVATWASPEPHSPGYAAMIHLHEEVLGRAAADELRVPFSLGEPEVVGRLCAESLVDVEVGLHAGTAVFPSLDAWLQTEIRGWTLADTVTAEQFAELTNRARERLIGFVQADGAVHVPIAALVASGRPAV